MEPPFGRGRDFLLAYHHAKTGYPSSFFFLMHVIGKLALVLLSGMLLFSSCGRPPTRLRIWASLCLIHAFLHCVLTHYTSVKMYDIPSVAAPAAADDNDRRLASHRMVKRLESMSDIMSNVLWSIAFYWTQSGGLSFVEKSPPLFWLKLVFLSFETPSMLCCICSTSIAFLVVFGCLPIPTTSDQKGASEDDQPSV